jgi:alpha-L-rhamnosidase
MRFGGASLNTTNWLHFRKCCRVLAVTAVSAACLAPAAVQQAPGRPLRLKCDSLVNPLGIDSSAPEFSWQLQDARRGARQTAYRLEVASSPTLLQAGKADVWDSGKVESSQSVAVQYGGPALQAEHRYYWRVTVWDQDGKAYPVSNVSFWETGLMGEAWAAEWIGYELQEHRMIREADAAWITIPPSSDAPSKGDSLRGYRLHFEVQQKPLAHADLFVTGQDAPSVWLNDKQVLSAPKLQASGRLPWKHYTQADVTSDLQSGGNLLSIAIIRYATSREEKYPGDQAPMSATLFVKHTDGSIEIFKTGEGNWKSAFNPSDDWFLAHYDDGSWLAPVAFVEPRAARGQPLARPWPTGPVKMLRRAFDVSSPVKSARLYATALGAYKFYVNGQQVGDEVLAPGWMDYREHVAYQAYDVTALMKHGANALGALLAPGWYTTPLQWVGQGYNYGDTPPALRAQLRIEHADGSVQWVLTDRSWKADASPIVSAEIYDGETYDARKVQPGWNTADFSDAKWHQADIIRPHAVTIVAQSFQPIREEKVLAAESIISPKPGVYIFDFGQNMAGVARIRVQGPSGTDVRVRFAEVLNPDGTLYVENLRTAKATDHLILAGHGTEEYEPSFTFHGFRYAEITGLPSKPAADALKAVVLHTDAPFAVELKTGSAVINQLWSNILWGQRSNFIGVPTDCPQRDERLGWTGDAQVFWRAASYNMDLAAFSRKFAGDLRGTQVGTAMYGIYAPGTGASNPGHAAGWSDAGVIVPWTSWLQTGDTAIIQQNWDGMEKYLAEIEAENPNYLWRKDYGIAFGDWLSPEGTTAEDLIATAYWAYDADLLRQMAHAVGKSADEKHYAELFEKIKSAFNAAYVRPDGFVGAIPPPPVLPTGMSNKPLPKVPVDTQTGYVLALHMNLLPKSLRAEASKRLADKIISNGGRLGTGFLGTPYLLSVLTDNGQVDLAYRLLLNTEYPSWGYLVEHGATTMWERWNGDQMRGDPEMNSYNHYAYGAVVDWIYRYAAGVDAVSSDAGFHTISLHPNFNARLGHVDFSYESPFGTVRSAWSVSGQRVNWTVSIPPNASAELPVSAGMAGALKLDRKPLADTHFKFKTRANETVYELPAGIYTFEAPLPSAGVGAGHSR